MFLVARESDMLRMFGTRSELGVLPVFVVVSGDCSSWK